MSEEKQTTVFINAAVPISADDAIRRIAAEMRTNRSEIVRRALAEYISNHASTDRETGQHAPRNPQTA